MLNWCSINYWNIIWRCSFLNWKYFSSVIFVCLFKNKRYDMKSDDVYISQGYLRTRIDLVGLGEDFFSISAVRFYWETVLLFTSKFVYIHNIDLDRSKALPPTQEETLRLWFFISHDSYWSWSTTTFISVVTRFSNVLYLIRSWEVKRPLSLHHLMSSESHVYQLKS